MRTVVRTHYDHILFGIVTAVMAWLIVFGVDSWRLRSAVLGVMVVAGVFARVIAYWRRMTVLEVLLALCAFATVIIGVIGTVRLDQIDAPATGVIGWVIASRLAWLGIIVIWPRIVGVPVRSWRTILPRHRRVPSGS